MIPTIPDSGCVGDVGRPVAAAPYMTELETEVVYRIVAPATLGPRELFGEGCLAGLPIRMGRATAVTPSTILAIEKQEMVRRSAVQL